MPLYVRSLAKVSVPEILYTFNRAFEGYYVPVQLDPAGFKFKAATEDIQLERSTAAYTGGELAGLILRGYRVLQGQATTYNAGTCVLQDYRGQRIVNSMYDFAQPFLWKAGVRRELLEVFVQNAPAIKAYERRGFQTLREVQAFKGIPREQPLPPGYAFRALAPELALDAEAEWECRPTWQFARESLLNQPRRNTFLGLYKGEELAGRLVYDPLRSYLMHLYIAPAHRGKGLARSILHHLHLVTQEPIAAINVDIREGAPLCALFQAAGLQSIGKQYEMAWEIPQA